MKNYLLTALGALVCLAPLSTVQAKDKDKHHHDDHDRYHDHDRYYGNRYGHNYTYTNHRDYQYTVHGRRHAQYRAAHWGYASGHRVWIPARTVVVYF